MELVFHFVFAALVICVAVAVGAEAEPSSNLLGSISGASGVLTGTIAKRYTSRELLVVLSGVAGLLFGGVLFTILIAVLRVIVH